MASPYPVYREIASLLNNNPELARDIDLDQLQPIIRLSHGAPGVLLDLDVLRTVEQIYSDRTSRKKIPTKLKIKVTSLPKAIPEDPQQQESGPAPTRQKLKPKLKVPKLKFKANAEPKPKPDSRPALEWDERWLLLNKNHRMALDMSQDDLERIIRWSDQTYYLNPESAPDMLHDDVYDYVKRIYNTRRLGTTDKKQTMQSISSDTGVGAESISSDTEATSKPRKERDAKLPIPLRSLDNMFLGEGDVAKWNAAHPGDKQISTKMDGTSALLHQGHLYTRGDATMGRDISHVIPYLDLPSIPDHLAVRGEIVMAKNLFNQKYKGKKGSNSIRKVNRNSVSGSIGAINHIDPEFLSDLTFAAYELIDMTTPGTIQSKPSDAFRMLEEMGFKTAYHETLSSITDENLSEIYRRLLDTYEFEIDGLVVHVDRPYMRETKKNPEYAQAFKEALAADIAITEITDIEWNPSQYGYLKPTVIYNPVEIGGVTLERATAHNAREVVKKGLGPGAKVEVIYWGKVNPRVHRVLEPVEPYMPKVPYKWVGNAAEPADIMVDHEAGDADPDTKRLISIKSIHKFLVEIGAKGIGETTVEKIYDRGFTDVSQFIHLEADDIAFLGPNVSKKMIKAIQDALMSITVPQLMAASKIFGRGLGTKKFSKVVQSNPEFLVERLTKEEYVQLLLGVEGFAKKTSELAAENMLDFWEFVDDIIPTDTYEAIINNTVALFQQSETGNSDINGKRFCLTGFRDKTITDFITMNGGIIQSGCNASTNVLIRSSSSYTNKKTEFAESHPSIELVEQDTFKEKYGL